MTSEETVLERHFGGNGPYRLVNGVSDSASDMFDEPVQDPINVDEYGHTRT